MDVYILNRAFEFIKVIDTYISFIWTERYIGCGDFELVVPIDYDVFDCLTLNNYVRIKDSETIMIIEEIEITQSSDDGIVFRVSGRSLESILDRRIIWQQTTISGSLQNGLKKIINENVIDPIGDNYSERSDRKISDFLFQDTDDEYILGLTLNAQYTGDNIYDVIVDLCEQTEIGFKIFLNDDKKMVFSLFNGVNRSVEQSEYPYVIFSDKTDNLISSDYMQTYKIYKNVTLILGEGEGLERERDSVGSGAGLDRRELYTDARDIQSKREDESVIPHDEYHALLRQRGEEKLIECLDIESFDGEIDNNVMFFYKKDYDIGDIVQIENPLGIRFKVRITEMVRSVDNEGYKLYPNFEVIE